MLGRRLPLWWRSLKKLLTPQSNITCNDGTSIVLLCDGVCCCRVHIFSSFFLYSTGEKRPSRERAKCRIPSILLTLLMTSKSFGGVIFRIAKITLWSLLPYTWRDSLNGKKLSSNLPPPQSRVSFTINSHMGPSLVKTLLWTPAHTMLSGECIKFKS